MYQSIVTGVAKQLDTKPSNETLTARAGVGRSAVSILPGIAADIARTDYALKRGLEAGPGNDPLRRALSPGGIARGCAELTFRYMKARSMGDAKALQVVRDEFKAGTCDPAW